MNRCEAIVTLGCAGPGTLTRQCRQRTSRTKLGHSLCGVHSRMLDRGAELVYATPQWIADARQVFGIARAIQADANAITTEPPPAE